MAKYPRSPLAPKRFPSLPRLAGLVLYAGAAGIRYQGRSDLMLALVPQGSAIAGVFTRSRAASAPVEWCRRAMRGGRVRALVVNSGNANAFTGAAGVKAVARTVDAAARLFGCTRREVFVASTGVIGAPLDASKILRALPGLVARRAVSWEAAARAIMTTDTFAKGAARRTTIDGRPVVVAGFAKGSGMIAPDMATLLAFLFSDARLPNGVLQELLAEANERTFNCVSVDGDTSTSDSVYFVATGQGPRHRPVRSARDPRLAGFRTALLAVMTDLAQQIAKDGEGAQKFVTVAVTGAASDKAARRIALTIANSPLVKTAIAGSDPNWGRIVAAVGRAGERASPDRLALRLGGQLVTRNGTVHPRYSEARAARHMRGRSIEIAVDVGVGEGRATVWTCDLTRGYIDINADYRS
jgi:glutamate N-acetyltransferase/amino-acid N-acetyltransferase